MSSTHLVPLATPPPPPFLWPAFVTHWHKHCKSLFLNLSSLSLPEWSMHTLNTWIKTKSCCYLDIQLHALCWLVGHRILCLHTYQQVCADRRRNPHLLSHWLVLIIVLAEEDLGIKTWKQNYGHTNIRTCT